MMENAVVPDERVHHTIGLMGTRLKPLIS